MKIVKKQITIKELTENYTDNQEDGVVGYGGKLDIRSPYHREFVYKDKQRDLVIDSILKGFPLNTMYWNEKDDGTFEVLDGQQRTISICQYVANNFSFEGKYFANLLDEKQDSIMNYELDIYKFKGSADEKLEWLESINVAKQVLTAQELLNAVYAGPWITKAKKIFSKTNCAAYQIGKNFMGGSPIRQDYLEAVLKWISHDDIKKYMDEHQHDTNADELWNYYENVIDWVKHVFVGSEDDIRKPMQSVAWGELYNKFGNKKIDSEKIQARVTELFKDEDIKKLAGIYAYVLDGDEKHLNIRAFDKRDKQKAYKICKGICANKKSCPREGEKCELNEMEADHITPWSKGGKTELDNCQMLCVDCNRIKSGRLTTLV